MNNFKSLSRLLAIFTLKSGGALGLLILNIVVARLTPLEQSGKFFLALNILTFLTPVSIFGIHIISLKYMSFYHKTNDIDKSELSKIGSNFLLYGMVLCLIFSVLCLIFSDYLVNNILGKPSLNNVFKITILSVFINGLLFIVSNQLQALEKYSRALIILSIISPYLTISILLFFKVSNVETTSYIYLFSLFTSLILGLIWLFKANGWNLKINTKDIKNDISNYYMSSISLVIISLMIVIVNWSNQLIAGTYLSYEDIAVFTAAQRTSNVVNLVLISGSYFITPKIAGLYFNKKISELQLLVSKSSLLMVIMAFPLLVIIFLFPKQILSLFGRNFDSGYLALCILSLSQFINVITGIVNPLLTMTGNEKKLLYIVLLSAATSIILGLLLIPKFGLIGGVIATSVSLVIQNVMAVFQVRRSININMLNFVTSLGSIRGYIFGEK